MKLTDADNQLLPRFSRRWWLAAGRTSFWVVVVSAMIWIYGDMEVTDEDTVSVTVRLFAGDRDRVVMLDDNLNELSEQRIRISFQARSSRSNLTLLKQRLSNPGVLITYDVSQGREPGNHTIPAMDILQKTPHLEDLGVSIMSAAPAEVPVRLDQVVDRELPVTLQVEGGALTGVPELTAVVRISQARWEQLERRTLPRQRVLRTERIDLSARPPGQKVAIEVQIIPEVAGERVRLQQRSLRIEAQVAPRETAKAEAQIKVGVRIQFPPEWLKRDIWKQYRFVTREDVRWAEVVVEGPRDEVDSAQRRPQDLDAYIILNDGDEKTENWWPKDVHVAFPAGLSGLKLKKVPSIEFRMEKIEGG